MKITKTQLKRLIKEELGMMEEPQGQTLEHYFKSLEDQLKNDFVGKRVKISNLARTVPENPKELEGVVTKLELGCFGYDGEGQVMFTLDSDGQKKRAMIAATGYADMTIVTIIS